MVRVRYDQRALALVEVRGGRRDWETAENEFAQRGWPVVTSFARGEDISAGVLTRDPDTRLYCVEVRLFGARNSRTERAAAWRVERLAKAARIEMYVRRCDLLDTDREQFTEWRVHSTTHRLPLRPPPGPRHRLADLRRRWAVLRTRFTERRGRHDTGTFVSGTASEARRLARMGMPTGAAPRTDVDVRVVHGPGHDRIVRRRERAEDRWMTKQLVWLMAMAFCVVFAHRAIGARAWIWGTLAVGCLVVGVRAAVQFHLSGGRMRNALRLLAVAALLLAWVLGWFPPWADPLTPLQMLVFDISLVTAVGVWLLVRQWSWGEWLAWAAPLVFAALVSFAVASGSVLHALYAYALGLDPEDLHVPGIWQVAAAGKLLSFLSLALVVPAGWGIAKHVHAAFLRPAEYLNPPLYAVVQIFVVSIVAFLAVGSSLQAADAVKAAAKAHRVAPPYFGVRPEWICVQPTVARKQLNVQGAELHPGRPYLSFGTSGDDVVLWGADAAEPFKVPTAQLRLLPAKDPRKPCDFPAREWERP
ncbi:NnrS multi-domain protein [Streptomyces sp. HUAS TT20]|uniref:NnrS multi-domain protein n=1 Tax=Streptomyces sp. HUAS TT20 TaxID=3447509 RepID=UPI0021D9037C|nr:NnrS multi-domain protein [Streptomyces sp. HUAS 15-9]UXY26919.1 NnrS multi-domain protein [Streptomyces sp. HUAS 15-9]